MHLCLVPELRESGCLKPLELLGLCPEVHVWIELRFLQLHLTCCQVVSAQHVALSFALPHAWFSVCLPAVAECCCWASQLGHTSGQTEPGMTLMRMGTLHCLAAVKMRWGLVLAWICLGFDNDLKSPDGQGHCVGLQEQDCLKLAQGCLQTVQDWLQTQEWLHPQGCLQGQSSMQSWGFVQQPQGCLQVPCSLAWYKAMWDCLWGLGMRYAGLSLCCLHRQAVCCC